MSCCNGNCVGELDAKSVQTSVIILLITVSIIFMCMLSLVGFHITVAELNGTNVRAVGVIVRCDYVMGPIIAIFLAITMQLRRTWAVGLLIWCVTPQVAEVPSPYTEHAGVGRCGGMHPRGPPEAPLEPRRNVGPPGPIKIFTEKKKPFGGICSGAHDL
jgi:hypothetical protein